MHTLNGLKSVNEAQLKVRHSQKALKRPKGKAHNMDGTHFIPIRLPSHSLVLDAFKLF